MAPIMHSIQPTPSPLAPGEDPTDGQLAEIMQDACLEAGRKRTEADIGLMMDLRRETALAMARRGQTYRGATPTIPRPASA